MKNAKAKVTTQALMDLWGSPEKWNIGIDYALNTHQIMTKLEDPPDESLEWWKRMIGVQSRLSSVIHKKFVKAGLYFRGTKPAKGKLVHYFLAGSADEWNAMYNRQFKLKDAQVKSLAVDRKLVQEKLHSLPDSFTTQKKVLTNSIAKRITF